MLILVTVHLELLDLYLSVCVETSSLLNMYIRGQSPRVLRQSAVEAEISMVNRIWLPNSAN